MKKLSLKVSLCPELNGRILIILIFFCSTSGWAQNSVSKIIEKRNNINFSFSESMPVLDSVMAQRSVSLGDLIQGQISNVKVTRTDGAPGAAVDIIIRGGTSVRGDFQPLYILDGIMLNPSQSDVANAWTTEDKTDYQAGQDLLWSINTQDIESIQVLKDASATALYGSRGANGVIIIKTKVRSEGKREINWSSNISLSTLSRKQDLLSGTEFKNYYRELTGTECIASGDEIDWQKNIFRPAVSHNHNLNISGSVRRTSYYVSLMANQKTGLVSGTNSLDLGLRVNLNQVISPMVSMGIRTLVARNQTNMTQSTSLLGGSSLITALSAIPFENMGENPYSWRDDYNDDSYTWRVIPQGYFDFNFTPWLKANVTAGMDYVNKERYRWMGKNIEKGALENARAGHSWMQTMMYNVSADVTFTKQFGTHWLQVIAGGELFGDDGIKLSNYASGFAIQTLKAKAINFASRAANPIYIYNSSTTYVGYGLANYKYRNLFDVQVGVRGDYLDEYDKSMRSYPFSNLKFNVIQNRPGYINSFSLKGGWGITGKNELIPYSIMNDITLGDASLFIPYEDALSFKGRLLTRMSQFNAGFDTELINSRIKLSGQFYAGKTKDRFDVHDFRKPLLVETADNTGAVISQSVPYDKIYWRKDIKMDKWGFEAAISAVAIENENVTWTIGANIGLDRSKITDCGLSETSPSLGATGEKGFVGRTVSGVSDVGVTAYVNGKAPGVFYGYMTQGIITEDHVLLAPPFEGVRLKVGDPKYVDVNKDGTVDVNDKVVIGNPNPDFIFGLNTNVRYKKWSFQVRFDGSVGNDVLNLNKVILDNVSGKNNVTVGAYEDAYRVSSSGERIGNRPMIGAQLLDQISDRMIEDGSFLRLSTFSVEYDVPLSSKVRNYLSGLKVNFMGSNLLVLTKYKGFDPDFNSFGGDWSRKGIDLGAYPGARTFSLGFVAKF